MAATGLSTLAEEHRVMSEGCALLDRSERGKLALIGGEAIEFLNGQVTNELTGLAPGEGRYAAFLTHKGKMLGDIRILLVNQGEVLLDTERVALQGLFDMIRHYRIGFAVELHKRTLERGLISLIGPDAPRVAAAEGLAEADEHRNEPVAPGEVPAIAVRTDVGLDLICAAEETERLRVVLGERGALDVSEEAAECLRIETGRPRYGIDIDETVIPQEAGLNARAVSFTKGCYVGQETVARLHYKGKPNRHLRGLGLSAAAAHGEELRLGERTVGEIGSAAVSPARGPIALALIRREAAPGTILSVGEEGITAEVLELPFGPVAGEGPPAATGG